MVGISSLKKLVTDSMAIDMGTAQHDHRRQRARYRAR